MPNPADYPLGPLPTNWVKKIRLALDVKKADFQDDADEAMKFFDGPYDFMYGIQGARRGAFFYTGSGGDSQLPRPTFAMTVNKVAEMVQLFGPVLYHRNPIRQVNPRKELMLGPALFNNLADPQSQQLYQMMLQQAQQGRAVDDGRAQILQDYLNYTPTALNLKDHSRWAIDEALIKGMGCLWTELYTPVGGGHKLVGSFYDTVDNLLIDPDMESLDQAKWIARRCVHPVWEVEQMYGLERGTLKGQHESYNQQAGVASLDNGDYRRKQGLTNDLVVYWKIWSKMGMGHRMQGIQGAADDQLDQLGNYCYLVVCDNCDYLLNVPQQLAMSGDVQAISQAVQWPTPFWADDGWPFTPILFHQRPRKVWPMSHMKPGMGELKFINWVYSFLAGKIRTTCRDFLVLKKGLGEEIKSTIIHGTDYEVVEILEEHKDIKELVMFLQHPPFNGDIWKVLEAVEANFEKRVGLTELMYGQTSHQYRSAEEANIKQSQLQIRPDDMANKVEDAMTDLARKEAFAARWHIEPQDVQPILGPVGAYYWQALVAVSDPAEILHQLEYRIEAGSTRKPNKDRDAANMQQAMTNLFQPLFQYAQMTGQVGPVNALLTDWAKSIDLDAGKYLLQTPPPPPMPAPGPAAGPAQPHPGPAPAPAGPHPGSP